MLEFALRFDHGKDQSIVLSVFAALLENEPSKLPMLGPRETRPEALEDMKDLLFTSKLLTRFNPRDLDEAFPVEGGK